MTLHKINNIGFATFTIFSLLVFVLTACSTAEVPDEPLPVLETKLTATAQDSPATPEQQEVEQPAEATVATRKPAFILPTAVPATIEAPTTSSSQSEQAQLPSISIGLAEGLPASFVTRIEELVNNSGELFVLADDDSVYENIIITPGGDVNLTNWAYAVAAPFATVAETVTREQVMDGWQTGTSGAGSLVLSEAAATTLSALWGPPSPTTTIVSKDELVDALWSSSPSWTLMPFEDLHPKLKLLSLDGQSLFDKELDINDYPLMYPIGLTGDDFAIEEFLEQWGDGQGNWDPARMTKVAMSGVTALSRATAYQMELRGITVPGEVVGPMLRDADFAHVSHEVSFVDDCPYPNPIGDPLFCARDQYLELLTFIGTDVVELTGNHLNDWGSEYSARSVDLYEGAGMQTFGGGRNLTEANMPLLIEHNGNKVAFVGCNPIGPAGDWATDFRSGSRPCDYEALYQQIGELDAAGYVVIATLQYAEYYQYEPMQDQQQDFRALIDAGAAAVSGSQGHHAQGFDLYREGFIHYGLGNLFFDQMDMLGTRQSFIDTYIIYEGRILGVELYTSMIEDYCCPREMTPEERAEVLNSVFRASGW